MKLIILEKSILLFECLVLLGFVLSIVVVFITKNSGDFVLPCLIYFLYPLVILSTVLIFVKRMTYQAIALTSFELTMLILNIFLLILLSVLVYIIYFTNPWQNFGRI